VTRASTTPKPITLIRELRDRAIGNPGLKRLADGTVALTVGTTYENRSNLPAQFFEQIVAKYEGTTLGQQELHAALLDSDPRALWKRDLIQRVDTVPMLKRIVVAIDPAVTATEDSSETGIVVAGVDDKRRAYVLQDLSGRLSPDTWAQRAVGAYRTHHADRIIGEQNNGGELVRLNIRTVDAQVPYKAVWASKGKHTRAEPIAGLYEQGKVFHVGTFPALEDQMCTWVPGDDSPDRLDALVWALAELFPDVVSPTPIVGPAMVEGPSRWNGGGSRGPLVEPGGERWIGS